MDKKRRKFLIRQKRKRKEKLQKLTGGVKNIAPSRIDVTKLKRADKFVGAEEALAAGKLSGSALVNDPASCADLSFWGCPAFRGSHEHAEIVAMPPAASSLCGPG